MKLMKCADLEIPMTVGSDSHLPSEVGWGVEGALDALRSQGIDKVHVFRKRNMEAIHI